MLYVNPLESSFARDLNLNTAPGRKRLAYRELEHIFLKQLLDEMSKSVPKDPLFGGGKVETDFQQESFNDALSGAMADSGQFGIAKLMEKQEDMAVSEKLRPVQNAMRYVVDAALMKTG